MAKEESSSSVTINAQGVIAIVFAFMLVMTIFNNIKNSDNWIARTFFQKPAEYQIGDSVINKEDVKVRQSAGGPIIGTQDEFVTGEIVGGPVMRSSKEWWRINYEDAPDGWVSSDVVTTKVAMQRVTNAVPLTFGAMRPTFIVLSIILFILLLIVIFKQKALEHMLEKKAEQEEEQKRLRHGNDPVKDMKPADETPDELPVANLPVGETPVTEDVHSKRWANVQGLVRSYNANDWKQAIIEADIILDDMLKKMGYQGKSIGERLKTVNPADFMTLDDAWEAHKFRNRIAHGSSYVLTKDEAERIIGLYEKVFSEFFYI
jgi:hypothetical protein